MKVDFVDLKHQVRVIYPYIKDEIEKVIFSANYFDNYLIERFEFSFAKYLNVKYVVGVSSGTDALKLILRYYNLNNEEVIVPVNTFTATAEAVLHAGGIPLFIDVCKENGLLTGKILNEFINNNCYVENKKLFNKKTNKLIKGIILVHLYGQCIDYDLIKKILSNYDLFIIEDSAQAHGCIYKDKKAGTLSQASAFSFYPAKNLGAFSDAGAIATNDKKLYEYVKMLKNHGSSSKYVHKFIGYTNRISAINAIVLYHKLKYLDKWNKKRIEFAKQYINLLSNIKEIKVLTKDNYSSNIFHLFIILSKNRDKLFNYLKNNNIGVGIHYKYPLHIQEAYLFLKYKINEFENANYLTKNIISLPMHQNLDRKQINFVVETLVNFYKEINENN